MAGQIPVKGRAAPKKAPAKRAPAKKATPKAPGKAVAVVDKDKRDTDLTPAKAKALTKRLHDKMEDALELVKQAWAGRVWKAMGLKSWDAWVDQEFPTGAPLSLPREKRKEVTESLAKQGWSTRAIAAATGVSQKTADRDIRDSHSAPASESNDSVPDNVITIPPGDITEEPEEGRKVTGLDGRTTTVTPKEPAVINVVSVAKTLAKDLDSVRIRLDSLFSRDDYEENKVDVQGTLETAVGDFLDTLAEEFGDLVAERAPEPEPVG